MDFVIPLKVKNGVVKTIRELRESFNENRDEMLKFIEIGQMEKFLRSIHEDDLSDMIKSMKDDGKNSIEIAKELANRLDIPFEISEDETILDYLVEPDQSLSDALNSERSKLNLAYGSWTLEDLSIKASKKIFGSGRDKSVVSVGRLEIDLTDGQQLEFKSMGWKSINKYTENCISEIIIKNGKVLFEDMYLENITIKVENLSEVRFKNVSFYFYSVPNAYDPVAINIIDFGKVEISEDSKFENVDVPVILNNKPIQQEDLNNFFYNEELKGYLIDIQNYIEKIDSDYKVNLKRPIELSKWSYTIEGREGFEIIAESGCAFDLKDGAELSLKNVKVISEESIGEKGLINLENSSLNVIECTLQGGYNCLRAKGSNVTLGRIHLLQNQ